MISAQLGTAQLGLAQLGSYSQLLLPDSSPSPVAVNISTTTINFLTLPDYFKMMGICHA